MSPGEALKGIGRSAATALKVALSVLLVSMTACAGERSDGTRSARIDTASTGRVSVQNTGAENWDGGGAWTLVEDLRLGTIDSESRPEEQFALIRDVASDSRGRIYVLEGQAQEVRVFLPDGTYSHTVGGVGEGPGEFTGASVLTLGPGDTLTVLDDGMMRYSVFSPDGELISTHPRGIVGRGPPRPTWLKDGSYLDWGIEAPDGRMGPRAMYCPIIHTRDFATADTFPPIVHIRDMVAGDRMPLMSFQSRLIATPDDEGAVWWAESRVYRIFRRTLDGDTTLSFSMPAEAPPVTEEDRSVVEDRWDHRPDIGSEQLEALPASKPVILGIVPDDEGHVFVFPEIASATRGSVVDVFEETGVYVGRMRLPDPLDPGPGSSPVVHLDGDAMYVVTRDDVDVPYVSRLRIRR